MPTPRGVTMVEVLVATVLLAIGVAGCMAALLGSARLRLLAASRESVAAVVERRLGWFESAACAVGDSVIGTSGMPTERWVLTRESGWVTMDGRAEQGLGTERIRVALRVRRGCP